MSDLNEQSREPRRYDTVDILRGVSILLVILLHGYLRTMFAGHSLRDGVVKGSLLSHLISFVFMNGDNGVTIFFAVSGFLITLTSLRRFGSLAEMTPARFYRFRAARILPLLLAVLAVLSALHLSHATGFRIPAKNGTLAQALGMALTFRLNWWEAVRGYLPANWDVLWSLSVEEVFYLGFPLAAMSLLRWRRRGRLMLLPVFVALLLGLVAMGPFARTVWTHGNEIWAEKSYLGGMDAIALGCLTALLVNRMQQRGGRALPAVFTIAVQVLGWLLVLWVLWWPRSAWIQPMMKAIGTAGVDGSILALGACLVMLGSVLRGRPGRRWSAPVRWMGRHSYELYMTHEFGIVWLTLLLERVNRGPVLLWIMAMLAAALPVGAAVARWYSEPMNRRLRGA